MSVEEVPLEEYKDYVTELLEKTLKAIKKDPLAEKIFERGLNKIEEVFEAFKKGEIKPQIYRLGPGAEIHHAESSRVKMVVEENKVVHVNEEKPHKYYYESSRLHAGKGFHVFGRLLSSDPYAFGYVAVKEKEEGPQLSTSLGYFRHLDEFAYTLSRLHAIVAPDPKAKEEPRLLYIHFGMNPPKAAPKERKPLTVHH